MVSVGDKLPCPKEADFLEFQSLYEDQPRLNTHRTIPAPVSCVVVAIARNCASTSNVFCRNIDNSGSGEGVPFQLRKLENRSFWKNEEVTNEGLKVGCLLEYGVVRRRCKLGDGDEEQFIFHRNSGTEPQDVDKILLDLRDDESVYGGLKEALIYYIRKILDEVILDIKYFFIVNDELLEKMRECFNPEDVDKLQQSYIYLRYFHDKLLERAHEYLNPEKLVEVIHDFKYLIIVYDELLEKTHECFNPEDVAEIPLDVEYLISAYDVLLKRALEHFNQMFQGLLANSACTRIFFIGIRAGMLHNERVTVETMSGDWLEMPLNCRESLVLSIGPVHLQLKRPWDVADDDVGGVAVVKYEAGEATCEGLILRYKPYVISRDEEPVEMQNAFGEVIPVRGCKKVLFDTGNEVGTGISRELLLKLNLQPDPNKKKKVELIGGESREFETTQIELVVRGHHLTACGLVDAVAKDTNLLVGMDVIQQLYDKGYTIGN